MDYFLIEPDFFDVYSEEKFEKLIEGNDSIWHRNITKAIELISGYLRARYDVDVIFRPLILFDNSGGSEYSETERVFWVPVTYDDTATYSIGEYVSQDNKIYKCKTEVVAPEDFDPAKWTFLNDTYSIYVCSADAAAGSFPDDDAFFTDGDDRNARIVEITVDIVLYNTLQRLNNIDITANRKERYDGNDANQNGGAIGWLKSVARGLIAPNLTLRTVEDDDQTTNKIIHGDANEVKEKTNVF